MPKLDRPLRVLHVISGDLWAGAEVQALTLLSNLRREGVIVAAALMNEGELARRLRAAGVIVHVIDETLVTSLRILAELRKLMRKWRPDVVHTHRTKENILGSLANHLATAAPCVRTVHGSPEHLNRNWRQAHKRILRKIDLWCGRNLQRNIVAVSADLGRKLQQDFREGQVVVIENGVDVEEVRKQVRPAGIRQHPDTTRHIGIVGRLVPVKRVDLFLNAALKLNRAYPDIDWRFHIFGDGPLRSTLATHAGALAIHESTTFHGHREDIVACIAELDALVICSDHEGLPMTLLEAMAVGTPIVAHSVGGMPTALGDYAASRLVNVHDSGSYAEAIHLLLSSMRLQNRPRTTFPARLNARENAAATHRLYEQLVA